MFAPCSRSARTNRSRKPAFEVLEDRCVPATFNPSAAAVDGQANSLRQAIIVANGNNEDDTITLEAGTYQLFLQNQAGQENAAATGDLDLTEAGRTITIQGAGAGVTIIDGGSVDRVFHILGGVRAIFRDLSIRNGFAQEDGTPGIPLITPNAHGGGILNAGELTLVNVVVADNTAAGEHGLSGVNPGDSGDNGKAALGGGIYNAGTLRLVDSTVRNNEARAGIGGAGTGNVFVRALGGSGGEAGGGGIWSNGTLTLEASVVHNNQALGGAGGQGSQSGSGGNGGTGGRGLGGGLSIAPGSVQAIVTNSTISTNRAVGGRGGNGGTATNGGGDGGDGGAGESGQGGGILTQAMLALRNSTIANNQATGGGAGVGGVGGQFGLPGSTGTPGSGQGGGVRMLGGNAVVNSVSTLIGDNTATNTGPDFSGLFNQASFTLLENGDDALGITNGVNGNIVGQDPQLGPLQNNGGPTPTHALLSGSPAINAGSNPVDLDTDQRGFHRLSGGATDIGAYERIVSLPSQAQPLPLRIRALLAVLENIKIKKLRRLRIVVRYADTGEVKVTFLSPYALGSFRNITAQAVDTNGDGAGDAVEVAARKIGGKKQLVKTTIVV